MFKRLLLLFIGFGTLNSAYAQTQLQTLEWIVGKEMRKALVYIPASAKNKATPVVFIFHGHGGTMNHAYQGRKFEQLWNNAIYIYPQGLPTPGQITDKEGKKNGWLIDTNKQNRDLAFFDIMLAYIKKEYMVDQDRVFATGHSNGGSFTYLLWATRGAIFKAFAPTGAAALKLLHLLEPKPFFHLIGEKDPLVKPTWQKITYQALLKKNKCETVGKNINQFAKLYHSTSGNPSIVYSYPGGHEYPQEANTVIIDFFKSF
ncbi:alpha/beta hydrolase family esterase [Pedobacter glucosidilyticus]|uniref:alpha/beta hydrolase family esterase n=1 Tax=Pedobacter glucosidilyticus TaxID=1122941 RepID=UPI00041D5D30|nr:prolyl oligopeptidase family serine peptidase [Pedobacter glucosidilyticus]